MANWDLITAYNSEASDWLSGENLPHPHPSVSRMPTTQQIVAAWESLDNSELVLIDGFEWDDSTYTPDGRFRMRGDRIVQLQILKSVCKYCGQLWLYPDTGEPAIIVDETIDPGNVCQFHQQCSQYENSWERFYRGQYAT